MIVQNQTGRQFECSREDYENLTRSSVRLTIISEDDTPKVEIKQEQTNSNAKYGIYLQRIDTMEENCASDRIRGEWITKVNDNFEIWRPLKHYDAVIFHTYTDKIESYNGIKILDICDPVWKYDSRYLKAFELVNCITVPTKELGEEIKTLTKTPICVVEDRHYFPYYESKLENRHEFPANSCAWFGYSTNFNLSKQILNKIKKHNLRLVTISNNKPCDSHFIKWDVDTCIKEISKCDFAVLPLNKKYKSNNKDITAKLSGIPVAKTASDIDRLVDPKERRRDMREDLSTYDVKYSADKYEKLIESFVSKSVIYTAICGGYDSPRTDIKCFTDSPSDKFIQPVMNAKIYKVLPHKYFDVEHSIWIDGNVFPLVSNDKIVELLGDCDMAVFKHPVRNCLYEEDPHASKRVDDQFKERIRKQMEDYKKEGMPINYGLAECGMLIRKHNQATEEFSLRWWSEICRYSSRDQLSFPYVAWKMGDRIKIKFIEGNIRNHKYFKYIAR